MHKLSHLRSPAWTLMIVVAGLAFSFGFACATPFAALAAIGSTQLRRAEALAAVLFVWLGNQAIGYLALHYPRTWDSFAWGGAIGIATVAAAVAAFAITVSVQRPIVRVVSAFAAAFIAYEVTLYAAGWILPSEGNAFAPWIVVRILEINAIACIGLLVLHRVTLGPGVPVPFVPMQRA